MWKTPLAYYSPIYFAVIAMVLDLILHAAVPGFGIRTLVTKKQA